uniref:Uncharacterized protein n=1 Tax=Globodera rostochiensis TaxID=31243 RepID=A0A914I0A0_GLORO
MGSPLVVRVTIFIFFILTIEGFHVMRDNLTVADEAVATTLNQSFFDQFEAPNEQRVIIEQEKAIEYLKIIHEILEVTDYAVNFTGLEEQIENMINNINKKLLENRANQQQIANDFERNFGKRMCRLTMFVSLAEFVSSEMKKILKQYGKSLLPRACARILRAFQRTSASIADPARTPFVERAWKAQLLGVYAQIKVNERWFEKIFDFMDIAKIIMTETRALLNDQPYIQSPEIKRQLNELLNREHLHNFVATKIELESNCTNE